MRRFIKPVVFALLGICFLALLSFLASKGTLAVIDPQGPIADEQKDLLIFATVLMLVIVIPVFLLTGWIAWRYRESNKKAKYSPDWDTNKALESIWWGFPIAIILVLSIVTWTSTHQLDPYRPLAAEASTEPVTIQVVALDWKWLFIYPDQRIATVNYLKIPEKTPINLEITSDAPMNSFWIPQLGGQIYAMPGMRTKLHLKADTTGTYQGSSANLSGEGFAGMRFVAESVSDSDFEQWLDMSKAGTQILNEATYSELSEPSQNNPQATFASVEPELFQDIIDKFMIPEGQDSHGGGHAH